MPLTHVSKAIPPNGRLGPMTTQAATRSIVVTYDRNNLAPRAAQLLPVALDGEGALLYVRKDGTTTPEPTTDDIPETALPIDAQAGADEGRVSLQGLAWPQGADKALLLLFHPQSKGAVELVFLSAKAQIAPLGIDLATVPEILRGFTAAQLPDALKGLVVDFFSRVHRNVLAFEREFALYDKA
jgi:hypothetical protein